MRMGGYFREIRHRRTQAFSHLQSHYLFRDRFGRPGKGNDKGKVEALVKTARRRFMVPIPKVHDLSVLNERLMARCLERLDALEAGEQAAALLADLEALRDLPAVPFEACEHVPGQVPSTVLVRYRLVDYSTPAVHAHKKVTVKGYVDRVEIALGAEIVARHRRSYVRGDVVYDPLHYLSLLEKKPGALDQAVPLRGWKLDPAFDTLRRLLEARFGPRGKREYIQVLRLHEDFPEPQVAAAVRDAVKRRLIGFDAVNLSRPTERVVAFYNQRGTAEQWIKEGKNAIKWTRLSCRKFRHNAVRLQLHALACNLGNFMRTLVLPDAVEQWSLTTLREKLVKIGAKIVRHGSYIVFQMGEVAIPRDLFADILRRIDRLRTTPLPTGRQDRPSCVKTTGPVCPRHGPTGNIECHHVPFTLNFVLSGMILVAEPIGLAL